MFRTKLQAWAAHAGIDQATLRREIVCMAGSYLALDIPEGEREVTAEVTYPDTKMTITARIENE